MKTYVKIIITVIVTMIVTFFATSSLFIFGLNLLPGQLSDSDALILKLAQIKQYIKNDYLYDDVDYKKANDFAIKGYIESLEEPYTHYYTRDEFSSYMGGIEESYVGIGVTVSVDTEHDKIIVISPTKDSPAYCAGIKAGDYILAVDGEYFTANGMDACVSKIKNGAENTDVVLTIERDGSVKDYTVTRKEIVGNSVSYEMLDDKIGYISISGFKTNSDGSDESTYSEFVAAVNTLNSKGMQKLIIDVRDNPGGVMDVVCQIADYILPEGIITYTESKTGKRNEYKSDSKELNIPMAILINSSSASASEILTGALKDYERAIVIGTKSFGKGIVQNLFTFPDGSGMTMTVSKYFTPNGTSIHGVGIEPNITVELPEEYKDSYVSEIPRDKDTQLNKAIEVLKNK